MEKTPRREREKKIHEEEILTAAEHIFVKKSFEAASMDEIAAEAQFTKRTLYQYFSNKEDLFFAVVLRSFQKLTAYQLELGKDEKTGFRKLYQSCMGYYRFYQDYPGAMGIISQTGHVKRKSGDESDRQKDLVNYRNEMFQHAEQAIREGIADGSVKPDIDAGQVSLTLIFLLSGFFNQLSLSGETFTRAFSLDQEEFSRTAIELMLGSIKNESRSER